jgi:SAM-dependent methyltransferase
MVCIFSKIRHKVACSPPDMSHSILSHTPFPPFLRAADTCLFCGAREAFAPPSDRRYRSRLLVCPQCGLARAPSEDTTARHARFAHCAILSNDGGDAPRHRHLIRAARHALARFHHYKRFLADPGCHRLLDIKTGAGAFVFLLRKLGKNARGLEIAEELVRFAQDELGLPVSPLKFDGDPEITPPETGEEDLDAVTFFRSLEFFDDPSATLLRCCKRLRIGGIVIIETPDIGSPRNALLPSADTFPARFVFNLPILEALGRKAGLQVVETFPCQPDGLLRIVFHKSAIAPVQDTKLLGNCSRVLAALAQNPPRLPQTPLFRRLRNLPQSLSEHTTAFLLRKLDPYSLLETLLSIKTAAKNSPSL